MVAVEFTSMDSRLLATASMDGSAKIFHIETGQETHSFDEHRAEVISVHFNRDGDLLLTGSFDYNAYLWDLRTERCVSKLNFNRRFYKFRLMAM